MAEYDDMKFRKYTFASEFDKSIHTLEGILKGITADKKINKDEINELRHWCQLYSRFVEYTRLEDVVNVILRSIEDGYISEDELKDILWVCNNYKTSSAYYKTITTDMQILEGMLHGILADNLINEEEIKSLKLWLEQNKQLEKTYPYDEIYSLVISVLQDGVIDDTEKKTLKAFFGEFIDTTCSMNINRPELEELKEQMKISGICAANPNVIIEGKTFCFTGASSRTVRSEIQTLIESKSGKFSNGITKKLDYLVIGDEGNPCWVFACYGRKVEKAISYRKEGLPLLIIHENDFWTSFDE